MENKGVREAAVTMDKSSPGNNPGLKLAFMMSVIGISFPEIVILRKVLKPKLIAVFVGVVTLGIMIVGFLFNAIL